MCILCLIKEIFANQRSHVFSPRFLLEVSDFSSYFLFVSCLSFVGKTILFTLNYFGILKKLSWIRVCVGCCLSPCEDFSFQQLTQLLYVLVAILYCPDHSITIMYCKSLTLLFFYFKIYIGFLMSVFMYMNWEKAIECL